MAQAQRNDQRQQGDLPLQPASDNRYDAGGPIAQLQADLARRLSDGVEPGAAHADPVAERVTRLVSRTGGYAALLAGYAGVAAVIAHFA